MPAIKFIRLWITLLLILPLTACTATPTARPTNAPPQAIAALPGATFTPQTTTLPTAAAEQPSPTPQPTLYALARQDGVNLRSGSGTSYPVIGTALIGSRLIVLGRSPDQEWIKVAYAPSPDGIAWVYQASVTLIDPALPGAPPAALAALDVRAGQARRDGDHLYVQVCFNLPEGRDWTIFDAVLDVQKQAEAISLPFSASTLDQIEAGRRCDTLDFHIFAEKELAGATLTILSIGAYPREGETCAWYLNQVQPRLDAKNSAIRIACDEQPGSLNLVVPSWPEGMTQEQAWGIANQEYLASIQVIGPWVFELDPASIAQITPNSAPPLVGLEELRQRRVGNFYLPGWLHLETHETIYTPATPLPGLPHDSAAYRMEGWYYLDEHSALVRAVERRFDAKGDLIETRVLKDGNWRNLTSGEITPFDPAQSFHLDFGFLAEASYAIKAGGRVTRLALYENQLYLGDQYTLYAEDSSKVALFNPLSGNLISLATWQTGPSMLPLTSIRVVNIQAQEEDPPEEILAYLAP